MNCPPRPRGGGQRAAPLPGAARPGEKGEPPRPLPGASSAWTSVPRREEDEPRWSACGRGPRAGRSTHPPPHSSRQPGPPFHPQRRPRRPRPVLPRGLPLVVRPSPGLCRTSQTEERPRQAGKMRKIREPWKRGPRIDRRSSVTAPQHNKRGSSDSWYRKRCRSATRTACVQRVSPGAPNVVPQSRGLPQKEGSNGRLSSSRDTRYGTRGPRSRADRNAKTSRHGLLAGDDGASHHRRPSS